MIFVFDGPSRPAKRGKASPQTHRRVTALLQETLKQIGVPCWYAPGEAEAQCAALQKGGMVDAVWSADSDTLMFGCSLQIWFRYDNGSKSNTHIRVTRATDIGAKFPGLDRDGLVLFAVLAGGDYDLKGLPGCGPKATLDAIKSGLGKSLVEAFEKNTLQEWRKSLVQHFRQKRSKIAVPENFPDYENVRDYLKPKVSPQFPPIRWIQPVDQMSLRDLLTKKYNFSIQEYIKWAVPVLLVGNMQDSTPDVSVEKLELKHVKTLSKKDSGAAAESRVSFSILAIAERAFLASWPVKRTQQAARIKEYVHEDRVKVDLLNYILSNAAPEVLTQRAASKIPATSKSVYGNAAKATQNAKPVCKVEGRLKKDVVGVPISYCQNKITQFVIPLARLENPTCARALQDSGVHKNKFKSNSEETAETSTQAIVQLPKKTRIEAGSKKSQHVFVPIRTKESAERQCPEDSLQLEGSSLLDESLPDLDILLAAPKSAGIPRITATADHQGTSDVEELAFMLDQASLCGKHKSTPAMKEQQVTQMNNFDDGISGDDSLPDLNSLLRTCESNGAKRVATAAERQGSKDVEILSLSSPPSEICLSSDSEPMPARKGQTEIQVIDLTSDG